jgi:hypothetical protein
MVAALSDDEHVTQLDSQLRRQHAAALELIAGTPPPQPPQPAPKPSPGERTITRRSADAGALSEVMREVQQALAQDKALRVDIDLRMYRHDEGDAE